MRAKRFGPANPNSKINRALRAVRPITGEPLLSVYALKSHEVRLIGRNLANAKANTTSQLNLWEASHDTP